MDKATIREAMRTRVRAVRAVDRVRLSEQAVSQLLAQEVWRRACSVLGYIALKDELDVFSALKIGVAEGKEIAVPRYVQEEEGYCAAVLSVDGVELRKGAFGVAEPAVHATVVPLKRLDLVLVPGVAFDVRGTRLGRGRGFYDRLLARVEGIKCGVALDEQIVEELPADPHDIAMNFILTPTRWLEMRSELRAGT